MRLPRVPPARLLIWLTTWAGTFVLYLVFTANAGARELVAGAIAATISTIAVAVFAVQADTRFRLRLVDVAQAWRIPWHVLCGVAQVLRALGQQLGTRRGAVSAMTAVPFDAGEDDPTSAGRRALAVSYATATPNFIILEIDREQRLMLYHQVLPGDVITMAQKLGAKP